MVYDKLLKPRQSFRISLYFISALKINIVTFEGPNQVHI